MFGNKSTNAIGSFILSELNSSSVQARLKAAGIDTNSKQYKAVIKEMFEQTKKEFLRENGVANGDTTKRSDTYTNLYRKMNKNDRLAAGYTMEQYERAYRQAFYNAAKAADSSWDLGKPIKSGALDNITREDIESNMKISGKTSSVDVKI